MDANQRSEINNQTNNGANEKWTPGSKGKTAADSPNDHTYPQGAAQQQGGQDAGGMGTQQSGAGPDVAADSTHPGLPGGSMQTQQTGGSGPVQGITDSHQRQMEQRSGAYGQLEQPVGDRPKDQGTALGNQQSGMPAGSGGNGTMNAQNAMQPELQGGSLGSDHGVPPGTRGGGQHGPLGSTPSVQSGSMGSQQSGMQSGTSGGGQMGSQHGGSGEAQQSVDRAGSQTGSSHQQDPGMHQSNDLAGGLPRSPGNSGPSSGPRDTHLTGAQVHANQQKAEGGVHNSNDAAGGYPKSPGGANKLAADEKMDDDTGFSNRG
ncbi:MAG: hypothetical protein ACJ8LG_16235 [Massilia sp.]